MAEDELCKASLVGGVFTFFSMFVVGRLTDRVDKLGLLPWMSAAAVVHPGRPPLSAVTPVSGTVPRLSMRSV